MDEQLASLQVKQTKIICTIGPATADPKMLSQLLDAGMDVARLNFSHGTHESHAEVIKNVRLLAKEANRPIAILQDLQGPKIRVGMLTDGVVKLVEHSIVTLGMNGADVTLPLQYDFTPYMNAGDPIFIDDGNIELHVIEAKPGFISAKVVAGGTVTSNKGINIPETTIPSAALTDKDRDDALFGIKQQVDYMALSFVQHASDIEDLRHVLESHHSNAKIIAKIERKDGVKYLEEIVNVSDGVMVARGDLALEAGLTEVPIIQQEIVSLCRKYKKPVIVATQMLESMTSHHTPTRAEVNDVASAVMGRTDAIMMSAETATGQYPAVATRTMRRIAVRIERHLRTEKHRQHDILHHVSAKSLNTDAVAVAAVTLAEQLQAELLVIGTASGYTALAVAASRTNVPVVAVTHDRQVYQQLALVWGIQAYLVPQTESTDEFFDQALAQIIKHGYAKKGAKIVIASGVQPGIVGGTNILKIHTIS
jgi:pyruvate kinase